MEALKKFKAQTKSAFPVVPGAKFFPAAAGENRRDGNVFQQDKVKKLGFK